MTGYKQEGERRIMKPIEFEHSNMVFAEDQPQYKSLPVYKSEDGEVIVCWKLSIKDKIKALFMGKMYHRIYTFNKPLQPIIITFDDPWGD